MSMTISPSKFGSNNLFQGFNINNTENQKKEYFKKPSIPYSFNALQPIIDAETLRTHYSTIHMNSYNRLCEIIGNNAEEQTIDSIFKASQNFLDERLSHAGILYNHQLYWENLSPYGGEMANNLQKAINDEFESTYIFKLIFIRTAMLYERNGWIWLILDKRKKLKIVTTSENINPLMTISPEKGIPLLVVDLFDHAFVKNKISNKNEFLKKIWMLINWNEVSTRYELAIQ